MPPSDEMVDARDADGTEENVAPVASLDIIDDDEDEATARRGRWWRNITPRRTAARAMRALEREAAPSLNDSATATMTMRPSRAAAAVAIERERGKSLRQPPTAEANGTMGPTREAVQSTENGSHAVADVEVKKKAAKDEAEADSFANLTHEEETPPVRAP